jgi:diguanylate cyclase (GGDEF)-like protein
MTKEKMSRIIRNPLTGEVENISLFKRFEMAFETLFIVFLTALTILLVQFVSVSDLFIKISNKPIDSQLAEAIISAAIILIGILLFLVRYSLYLRKKMKRQFIAEVEIKRLAFFDSLTNLPNRDLCLNRLEHAIARAARNKTSIAILFISIDDFKSVNDKQGHDGGDKLLKQVAKRLSSELSSGDTLARITGVEFLVILETLSPKENINIIAEKLLAKLIKCYRISMQEVYITSNIGISMYPSDGEYSKELIKNADTAMCFAKDKGLNGLAFFSKEMQDQANKKKKIAEQLRGAMDREEFVLHYQPIIATGSRNIIAVEALLRWHNELLGNLAPDVFIPIAEEIGIITKIGDWVLAQACQQNKSWQEQGYPKIVVSVNLSVMQLAIRNYAETVSSSLANTQLDPQYLELEFTENTLMKDAKQTMVQLRQLNALGVSLALDDFGTGYSSMKYLSQFKLNKIKIDGSFIKKLPDSARDIMTTRAIIALAKQLKLQVTAEGVETAQQCEYIETCHVDAMQGYHFSRPVDAEAFTRLLIASPR